MFCLGFYSKFVCLCPEPPCTTYQSDHKFVFKIFTETLLKVFDKEDKEELTTFPARDFALQLPWALLLVCITSLLPENSAFRAEVLFMLPLVWNQQAATGWLSDWAWNQKQLKKDFLAFTAAFNENNIPGQPQNRDPLKFCWCQPCPRYKKYVSIEKDTCRCKLSCQFKGQVVMGTSNGRVPLRVSRAIWSTRWFRCLTCGGVFGPYISRRTPRSFVTSGNLCKTPSLSSCGKWLFISNILQNGEKKTWTLPRETKKFWKQWNRLGTVHVLNLLSTCYVAGPMARCVLHPPSALKIEQHLRRGRRARAERQSKKPNMRPHARYRCTHGFTTAHSPHLTRASAHPWTQQRRRASPFINVCAMPRGPKCHNFVSRDGGNFTLWKQMETALRFWQI